MRESQSENNSLPLASTFHHVSPCFFPPSLPDCCFSDSFSGFSFAICSLDAGNGQGLGFPGGSDGKESAGNAGGLGLIPGFNPWVGKIPLRREGLPTLVRLLGEFHGQRSLVGHSPRGCKVGNE